MAKTLTTGNVIEQIEHLFGRQPEKYIIRLINEALLDIASEKQHYTVSARRDLIGHDRWYGLTDDVIDIVVDQEMIDEWEAEEVEDYYED